MFAFYLNESKNIKNITLHFFEACHGQNEGDSAHSAITAAVKQAGDIFIPSQIIPIIKLARRKHPYIVHEMAFSDFLDFKTLSQDLRILSVRQSDEMKPDSNDSLNWTKMSAIMVDKETNNKIFYKNSHMEETFQTISLQRNVDISKMKVKKLNNARLKLPLKKYSSLMSLCVGSTPVIRIEEYQAFYRNLPHLNK